MAEIIDVSDWVPSDDVEWMGTRSKLWLEAPEVEDLLWLFKEVRCKSLPDGSVRCFGEDWAEWLAAELTTRMGVPAAEVRMAARHGREGVLSRSMLVDGAGARVAEQLEHGNELLQAVDPAYDKDQRREAVGYTIDAVWRALSGLGVPPECEPPIREATDLFAGLLVVDALIANSDRHHENWGALSRGSERWLAPAFDQGTCLGFQEPDEERIRFLERRTGHGVEVWVERGRSGHFEGRPGLVELSVDALARVPADVAEFWAGRVEALDLEWWRDTIDSVPADRMSHPARTFAFEIVRHNRQRLMHAHRTG